MMKMIIIVSEAEGQGLRASAAETVAAHAAEVPGDDANCS